jgi:outer membrane lipoprotein-sorting protein
MNKKIIMIFVLLLLLVVSSNVFAAPKIDEILKQIDFIQDLKTDGTAQVTMTQQKTGEGVKVYEAVYYRRDKDDSFLIVFTAPEVEKGNGYMKVDDNMWVYRRNTRTFQHMNRD